MATRTKRTARSSKSSGVSDLARAAAQRGGAVRDTIANDVVNRIVSNSTEQFQNYLSQIGNGSAMDNASSLARSQQVQPAPFGNPAQLMGGGMPDSAGMRLQPAPFGSPAQLLGGGMPDTTGMQLQPAPFADPPLLSPGGYQMPSSTAMPPSMMPMPPTLSPSPSANRFDPEMEQLLRQLGII